MNHFGRIMLGLLLAAVCQTQCLAAADKPAAVVHSSGTAAVNGSDAAATTAVFVGDTIQTKSGVMTISAPGSTVIVPSSSELVLQQNAVQLSSGVASINTTKGMSAQTDALTIAPATAGTAKYDVKRSGSVVEIHASSGALTVNSSDQTIRIAEGQTAALNTGTGLLSAGMSNASHAPQSLASSGSSIFDLDKTRQTDPTDVKYCATAICHKLHHISNTVACKCRWF